MEDGRIGDGTAVENKPSIRHSAGQDLALCLISNIYSLDTPRVLPAWLCLGLCL